MKDNKSHVTKFVSDDMASWDYAQIWDKFPVPARPSKEELDFLKKELKEIPHKNLLILGSTIEYRKICKELGIVPDVADFKKSNYEILTRYAKENFGKERFLEVDWLKINEENKYDVIIGHRAINVIGKEVLPKFFKQMFEALKPGGIFYCKGNVFYDNDHEQFNQLVDKWAFFKNREYPLFSYLEVNLYFKTADKDGYVIYPEARQIVNQLFADKKCLKKDYELIKLLVSMSKDTRFRGLIKEKEVRDQIKKAGFSTSEWIVLDKNICQNMPIIKLKK